MTPSREIASLLEIMRRLRDPQTGCPWDIRQTFETIKPYTIEEAYEVADAIERGDPDDLCDELGDLLLQVVFHAQMASEQNQFDFGDVVSAITAKMIRRHPHIFADSDAGDAKAVKVQWEDIKAQEKAERAARRQKRGLDDAEHAGFLDSVPRTLPSLVEALKLQERAARVGFDWSEADPILNKIEEEIAEVRAALSSRATTPDALADAQAEVGDVLFAVANLARHLDGDPEQLLRGTNTKFRRRFAYMEQRLTDDETPLADAGLPALEALWQDAKQSE
jgi:nucleoside triphosphate diphosphatase